MVSVAGKVLEYCSFESFHPVCSNNELVVMTSAIYGRMREGRCLKLNTKISSS